MLLHIDAGIQQALDECAGKHDSKAANESGKDYKCYRTTTSPLPTGDEVLRCNTTSSRVSSNAMTTT